MMTQNNLMRLFMIGAVITIIYGFLQMPRMVWDLFPGKSINVLVWPEIDNSEFHEFEKKTGIRVHLTYFENYEELLLKMRAGAGDYDLVMLADYAVAPLLENKLVKPIDSSRLLFLDRIYPTLLHHYFDPENRYTIPFSWTVYGIGVDTSLFQGTPPESWKLLFDPAVAQSGVGMLDDAREIISIAALYLFGKQDNKELTKEQLDVIKTLLFDQKSWVTMYTDLRVDYLLLSQTVPVAMGLSSDIYKAMQELEHIQFIVPEEGSFMQIDNFMIPASTKKDDYIYAFLNFIYEPHIVRAYVDKYNFFPAQDIESDVSYILKPTQSLVSRLSFLNYKIPEELMRSLWITLKS